MLQGKARDAVKKFLDDPSPENLEALEPYMDEVAAEIPDEEDEEDPEFVEMIMAAAFGAIDEEEMMDAFRRFLGRAIGETDHFPARRDPFAETFGGMTDDELQEYFEEQDRDKPETD